MLYYACVAEAEVPALRRDGVPAARLTRERPRCAGPVLVVEAADPPPPLSPPGAIRNLDPYRPPRPVEAAGGYVVRRGAAGPEVLLIFRRGVWDLPKGKRDAGESREACALREVREEVGIRTLRLIRPLGTTVHGYERKGRYEVKTTYWYLMETPETRFTPQAEEDIEAVAWVPWAEARTRLGYATLRAHMAAVEGAVRAG